MNQTEAELVNNFLRWLRSRHARRYFPAFRALHPELDLLVGTPDLVASARRLPRAQALRTALGSGDVSAQAAANVLALLKPKAARTVPYLQRATGLTERSLCRVLSSLAYSKVITETDSGSYRLRQALVPETELWAFEFKLRDWRRALFQALRCKTFASRVVTVFPKSQHAVLTRRLDYFRERGVGVFVFDPVSGDHIELLAPAPTKPTSRRHHVYATYKVVSAQA